jgi:CRP-like cAMP-binding protein
MPLIPDKAVFQNSLASLPLVTFQPGETVIADGSRTDRLLILRKGTVAVVKEGTEIAKVTEPGAVFGELSVLLDQPHTPEVRALETSQFHLANATTLLAQNPVAVLYVATMLAHRMSLTITNTGATNGEKSFNLTDRFGDHAVRLADLKLVF